MTPRPLEPSAPEPSAHEPSAHEPSALTDRSTAAPHRPNEVAPALLAAWGVESRPRAGRAPSLSVAAIVAAAVKLADVDGLAGCSMPRLAEKLGVATMTLYRYVRSKTELSLLMADAARGKYPAGPHPDEPWRDVLTRYADHALASLTRHPWALDVPTGGFPQTPNLLEWLDSGLLALSRAGLGDQQCLGVMLLLDGHAANTARLSRAGENPAAERRPGPPVELMGAARFPALLAMIERGALADDEFADFGYSFGLARVLAAAQLLMTNS